MTEQGAPPTSRWQQEFPYHWDADENVGRREFLRFAVFASGALFAGTVALAILGRIDDQRRGSPKAIAKVSDVKPGEPLYFHYPGSQEQAVLVYLPGQGYLAYSQKCTHLSCAVYYQRDRQRLYCPCHDGAFDIVTGEPIQGPPRRRLPRILMQRRGDELFAMERVP